MSERKKTVQGKEQTDYYFLVMLSQLLCCIGVVALFFFIKGGEGWQQVKEKYAHLLEEDFLTVEIDSVVSNVKDYLSDGSVSFAVNASTVEPYTENESAEQSRTQLISASYVYSAPIHSDESYSIDNMQQSENQTVALGLSYAKKNSMLFPVEGGRYTSLFGERTDPMTEGSDFHKGIDIGADEGDSIRAVYDGRVISVGQDSLSGLYVFLEHESGTVTFYCHCSKLLCRKGDTVKQGDTIALVGSTGYSTGPHLHFEVRVNGTSIDPAPLLSNAA